MAQHGAGELGSVWASGWWHGWRMRLINTTEHVLSQLVAAMSLLRTDELETLMLDTYEGDVIHDWCSSLLLSASASHGTRVPVSITVLQYADRSVARRAACLLFACGLPFRYHNATFVFARHHHDAINHLSDLTARLALNPSVELQATLMQELWPDVSGSMQPFRYAQRWCFTIQHLARHICAALRNADMGLRLFIRYARAVADQCLSHSERGRILWDASLQAAANGASDMAEDILLLLVRRTQGLSMFAEAQFEGLQAIYELLVVLGAEAPTLVAASTQHRLAEWLCSLAGTLKINAEQQTIEPQHFTQCARMFALTFAEALFKFRAVMVQLGSSIEFGQHLAWLLVHEGGTPDTRKWIDFALREIAHAQIELDAFARNAEAPSLVRGLRQYMADWLARQPALAKDATFDAAYCLMYRLHEFRTEAHDRGFGSNVRATAAEFDRAEDPLDQREQVVRLNWLDSHGSPPVVCIASSGTPHKLEHAITLVERGAPWVTTLSFPGPICHRVQSEFLQEREPLVSQLALAAIRICRFSGSANLNQLLSAREAVISQLRSTFAAALQASDGYLEQLAASSTFDLEAIGVEPDGECSVCLSRFDGRDDDEIEAGTTIGNEKDNECDNDDNDEGPVASENSQVAEQEQEQEQESQPQPSDAPSNTTGTHRAAQLVARLPCSHAFHLECVTGFMRLNRTCCPFCNTPVKAEAPPLPPRPTTRHHAGPALILNWLNELWADNAERSGWPCADQIAFCYRALANLSYSMPAYAVPLLMYIGEMKPAEFERLVHDMRQAPVQVRYAVACCCGSFLDLLRLSMTTKVLFRCLELALATCNPPYPVPESVTTCLDSLVQKILSFPNEAGLPAQLQASVDAFKARQAGDGSS
ncbi:uncharacterized protein MONBRDRAFT_9571 [Monosiga brevicollis MX1]|uniref:RING-type domain-containing protein n=1 Tax=Monosiga brevicollis TaxID=81824 RepID=A9V3Q5_MONBE|nr:uncharacterized protein MONBRDRAFT_9571 [Monosiga brevicollis MX1]EDQ87746.1 predicted protein [Monosiga brevicollis MX1]|eukprot:XP_001747279.1 hypothetical protein [Monosiga brevicollis MX1]